MIGSIAGFVLLVVAGLALSAWSVRRRSGRNARSDAAGSDAAREAGSSADSGTAAGDNNSGWLGYLFGQSSGNHDASPASPSHVAVEGGSSDAGTSDSGGAHTG
ncbi:hypothetical protein SAMN05519104_6038 [Rhizobiales bacterium GAS188]|nr:hypothetical protein SAMN05519104_6038 [Rhizobiales bacterium GAS188]